MAVANESGAAPPSAINPAIMRQLESLSSKLYGGIPVVPIMDTGASDGKFLRLAAFPRMGSPGSLPILMTYALMPAMAHRRKRIL